MVSAVARFPPWQVNRSHEGLYFYNEETGKSTWTMPPELRRDMEALKRDHESLTLSYSTHEPSISSSSSSAQAPAPVRMMDSSGRHHGNGQEPEDAPRAMGSMPDIPVSDAPQRKDGGDSQGLVGQMAGFTSYAFGFVSQAAVAAQKEALRISQNPEHIPEMTQIRTMITHATAADADGQRGTDPRGQPLIKRIGTGPLKEAQQHVEETMPDKANCCEKTKQFLCDMVDFKLQDYSWKTIFARPRDLCGFVLCVPGICCTPAVYFAMRLFLLVLWFIVVGCSWLNWSSHPYRKWWIYFTHQAAILELLYLLFATISTGMAAFGKRPDGRGRQTPWFVRVTWLLADATPCIVLMASALFWLPAFTMRDEGGLDIMSKTLNAMNVVIVFVDIAWSRQPLSFAHAWVPLLYTVLYIQFTWVYHQCGGKDLDGNDYIYDFLDWTKSDAGSGPTLKVVQALSILVIPVVYFALLLVLKLLGYFGCAWRERGDESPWNIDLETPHR